MNPPLKQHKTSLGILLAVFATFIWAGNFIIARGVHEAIPPITLAFYRWLLATIIILPFAIRYFINEWKYIKRSWHFLFWASLTGISLFNTFVYIGGHYTTAINLALIGTTSSPVLSIILARIFLKEKLGFLQILGLAICIAGILFLLSKGNINNLLSFRFSKGDIWVLMAAFTFAVYNTLVKKKPVAISPINFLFASFLLGTLLLVPFFIWEQTYAPATLWSTTLVSSIIYLSFGASVICFLLWNQAIGILGAGRTALFGNLIPIFASLEAVIILKEKFDWVNVLSMVIVFTGILLANLKPRKTVNPLPA